MGRTHLVTAFRRRLSRKISSSSPSLASLEQTLNDVKCLYKDKFGLSVQEEAVEEDGIKFFVTRGVTPSLSSLEQTLNDVKGLYKDKVGEEDGIKFYFTRGVAPSVSSLEQTLDDMKR